MIQKQKTEKETEKNKTIPKLVLNNFLENIDTEIPNDLLPYITIVDYNTKSKLQITFPHLTIIKSIFGLAFEFNFIERSISCFAFKFVFIYDPFLVW